MKVAGWLRERLSPDHVAPANLWSSIGLLMLSFAAAGFNETVFAQPNVIAWGSNTYGQTNVPPDLTNAIAVAAGQGHSVALRANGTVVAWGLNNYGQTNVPVTLSNVIAVACGTYHSLALRNDGTVAAWGGPGPMTPPADLSNVVAVAGSFGVSFAVLDDGSIKSWPPAGTPALNIGNVLAFSASHNAQNLWVGVTLNGVLLNGASSYSPLPTNSVYSLYAGGPALSYDGRVSRIVTLNGPYVDAGLSNVVAICPGPASFLALNSDGTLNNGPAGASNLVGIAASTAGSHYLALVGSGPPVFSTRARNFSINYGRTARFYQPAAGAWPIWYQWRFNGVDIPGATTPMLAVTNVSAADFGSYQLIASNAVDVTASPPFKLSLLPIVGPDLTPNLTDVVSIACSSEYGHYLALKRDRTVVAWGPNGVGQCNVPASLSNVVAISCCSSVPVNSPNHSLALTDSGTVYSWGVNFFTNTWPSLTNLSVIFAGNGLDAAISTSGGFLTWFNSFSTNSGSTPVNSSAITNAAGVSVNRAYNSAYTVVRSDGQVTDYTAPAGVSNVISIARSSYYSLGLRADGTVMVWGSNSQQHTNVTAGLRNVVQIASSDANYALALRADGTVAASGAVPPQVSNTVAAVTNAVQVDGALALIGNGPPFVLNRGINGNASPGGQVFFREIATGERPLHYQWQFAGADLVGETNNVLSLTNVQISQTGAYNLVVTNVYGAVTSSPSLLTVFDYGLALGGSGMSWSSFGDAIWFPETNVTHDGLLAVQTSLPSSPGLSSLSSDLRATVVGPGTLTFWWKISSRGGPEFLSFYLNGQAPSEFYITGQTDWQQRTVYLGAGPQIIDFIYRNYGGYVPGDAAWIDQVVFAPGTSPAFITTQPVGRSQALGGNSGFSVGVQGTPPFSYQWFKGQEAIPDATNSGWGVINLQPSDVGTYSVLVSNVGGTITSTNVVQVLGRIASWPDNSVPDTITNAMALDRSLAMLPDGSVRTWDSYGEVPVPSALTNTLNISAGGYFNAAVNAADRSVFAWGDNAYGETNVPSDLTNVAMVSCGDRHAAALNGDGSVVCWGYNYYGQTNVPSGLSNVVFVSAGFETTAALKSDGTLVVWGDNTYGLTNPPTTLTNLVSVCVAYDRAIALVADGSVLTWGNTNGSPPVPPNVSNILAVACLDNYAALNDQGQVLEWGPTANLYLPPATLTPLKYLARTGRSGLVTDGAITSQVSVRNPALSAGAFQVSVASMAARVYRLEFKDSLLNPAWQALPLMAGTGRELVLTDPNPGSTQRFYRVRSW